MKEVPTTVCTFAVYCLREQTLFPWRLRFLSLIMLCRGARAAHWCSLFLPTSSSCSLRHTGRVTEWRGEGAGGQRSGSQDDNAKTEKPYVIGCSSSVQYCFLCHASSSPVSPHCDITNCRWLTTELMKVTYLPF